MSDSATKLNSIINDFYVRRGWTNETAPLKVKDYQLDFERSFEVFFVIKDRVEYCVAGVFYDFNGAKVFEYGYEGEAEDEAAGFTEGGGVCN